MQRSTDRFLTTHVGSLPRPPELVTLLNAKDAGRPYDAAALASAVRASVFEVVRRQVATGLDTIDDGEHSKSNFTGYLQTRLGGLGPVEHYPRRAAPTRDRLAFRDAYDEASVMLAARPSKQNHEPRGQRTVAFTGPVTYTGVADVAADLVTFGDAVAAAGAGHEGFVTALSPGNLAGYYRNDYYANEDELFRAVADALNVEYRAIVDAGFILQIDDPRLVTHWDRSPAIDLAACRRFMEEQVEVLNHALRGIPADRVRYHTCYSTNIAPRANDLELVHYVDIMLKVRAGAYSIEAANPRHDHEWIVWRDVKWPEGKILIPGVISHCVSLVEHPELVAQRIMRYARTIGRENVIAGADCGFASSAAGDEVHPDVAWAKLESLVAGARLASKRVWK